MIQSGETSESLTFKPQYDGKLEVLGLDSGEGEGKNTNPLIPLSMGLYLYTECM